MKNKFQSILQEIKTQEPLVHCITNPISINQCANTILSVGAGAIMAEHPKEVQGITESANALMLNMGNITDVRMQAMEASLKVANQKDISVILDVVGVACSNLRREYVINLLKKYKFSVIKGNYSEIEALHNEGYFCR